MAETEVCHRAEQVGIELDPLSAHRVTSVGDGGVLMGFTAVGERSLVRSVKSLRKVLARMPTQRDRIRDI